MLFLLNGRSRIIKAYGSLGMKIKVKRVILISNFRQYDSGEGVGSFDTL